MAGHPEKAVPLRARFKAEGEDCMFCGQTFPDIYVFDKRFRGQPNPDAVESFVCTKCNNGDIPTREKTP